MIETNTDRENETILFGVALDRACDICGGTGRTSIKCMECDGAGFILTDNGERLLEFLRRHAGAAHS